MHTLGDTVVRYGFRASAAQIQTAEGHILDILPTTLLDAHVRQRLLGFVWRTILLDPDTAIILDLAFVGIGIFRACFSGSSDPIGYKPH